MWWCSKDWREVILVFDNGEVLISMKFLKVLEVNEFMFGL